MISLDEFEQYFKRLSKIGVFSYLSSIPNFFIHPRSFWDDYLRFSKEQKFIQFLTYATLFMIISTVFSIGEYNIGQKIKLFIEEIVVVMPFFLAIAIGIIALHHNNIKGDLLKLFVFTCYTKFFFCIVQAIFLSLYSLSESYIYLSIALFFVLLAELYLIFVSSYVYNKSFVKGGLCVLIMVIVLSGFDFLYAKFSVVDSTDAYADHITKERFELGKSIKNAYTIPSYVVSNRDRSIVYYLYSNPCDSIASKKQYNIETYIKELESDMDSLKAISSRATFRTNRDFFDSIYMIKREVISVHNEQSYFANKPIRISDILYKDKLIDTYETRPFDNELIDENSKLFIRDIDISSKYRMACWPLYVRCIYRPVLWIMNK